MLSLALSAMLFAAPPAASEDQKLTGSGLGHFAHFGTSVAFSGDTAVVGVPGDAPSGAESGSAIIFVRSGTQWVESAKLVPGNSQLGARFGEAVAIDGDRIAVGAPVHDGPYNHFDVGALYVFERVGSTWSETDCWIGAAKGDYLARSVALEGDTLAAGAPGLGLSELGGVYVYRHDGLAWTLEALLVSNAAVQNDELGARVDLDGDTLVAGAPPTPVAFRPGTATVFSRNGTVWSEHARITASDGTPVDEFGDAVTVAGDTLAVGAPLADLTGANEGAVYLFERAGTQWLEQAKLVASDFEPFQRFGADVAMVGDLLVAGAQFGSSCCPTSGAYAFLRRGTVWSEEAKLTPSDGDVLDGFGSALATDAGRLLVGAKRAYIGFLTNSPAGAAFDPASDTIYMCDFEGRLLTVSWPIGLVLIGPIGFANVQGIAFDASTGLLYGVDVATDQLITIDPASGVGAAVGPLGFVNVRSLACDSGTGVLYGVDALTRQLVSIDPATGAGTAVGLVGLVGVQGLAFDPSAGVLYGESFSSDELITIDTSTGAASVIGPIGASIPLGRSLAFDANAGVLYGDVPWGPPHLATIDPITAQGTEVRALWRVEEGAVYDFTLELSSTYCTAGASASGCTASIAVSGSASASAASGFELLATGVEGAAPGTFFFSSNGRQANPWGNGTSYRCVVPPVVRTGLQSGTGTPGACDGSFTRDLNALWCPTCPKSVRNPGPGHLTQAQLWYRDGQNTSNRPTGFSDAIEFLVGP
jgi:hypothetical protein